MDDMGQNIPSPGETKIVYFGGDATNPTLILRINSFLSAGLNVTAFTFRRNKFNTAFKPNWRNIHLGETTDRRYGLRLAPLLKALLTIMKNRAEVQTADVIYARMFDAAMLGLFAKWFSRSKARLVYEVEDVQAIFFKRTLAGGLFRWLERRLLKRTQLLVCMSPGFVRGYFEPVQHYHGPTFILENKLQLEPGAPSPGAASQRWKSIRNKWRIGWFGTLRCEQSMRLLATIADRLGDKVEIYTRGYPTETGLERYMEFVRQRPNWTYEGEYTIPRDLEEMYGSVHFSWCFDFLDSGGNSELLLACRMYQGGYYGAVPLVAQGAEMARFLAPHKIGHAFAAPYAEGVCEFLSNLSWEDYEQERERVRGLGPELFLDTGRDVQRLFHDISIAPLGRGGLRVHR
ncbi:MAG: glycosyltransferase [Alphaproteobacteria bacterium]